MLITDDDWHAWRDEVAADSGPSPLGWSSPQYRAAQARCLALAIGGRLHGAAKIMKAAARYYFPGREWTSSLNYERLLEQWVDELKINPERWVR